MEFLLLPTHFRQHLFTVFETRLPTPVLSEVFLNSPNLSPGFVGQTGVLESDPFALGISTLHSPAVGPGAAHFISLIFSLPV